MTMKPVGPSKISINPFWIGRFCAPKLITRLDESMDRGGEGLDGQGDESMTSDAFCVNEMKEAIANTPVPKRRAPQSDMAGTTPNFSQTLSRSWDEGSI